MSSARAGRGLTRLHRCPACGAGPGDPCDGGDDHRLRVATAEREARADLQADLAEEAKVLAHHMWNG